MTNIKFSFSCSQRKNTDCNMPGMVRSRDHFLVSVLLVLFLASQDLVSLNLGFTVLWSH